MKNIEEIEDPLERLEAQVRKEDMEERALVAVSDTRVRLIMDKDRARGAFFATLALKLTPEANWDIETAATDGKVLAYNPEWWLAQSPTHQVSVMAHEVMHPALGHHARRQYRDLRKWNIATDMCINPLLEEAGFALPASAIFPGRGSYPDFPVGEFAEKYYDLLEEPEGDQGGEGQGQGPGGDQGGDGQGEGDGDQEGGEDGQGGPGNVSGPGTSGNGDAGGDPCPDPGGTGGVMDAGDGSPAAAKEGEAEWEVLVAQAREAARTKGALAGGLARMVEQVLQPRVDWKEVLREFVSRWAKNDYSWFPPNRRFVHQGLYLPSLRSEELGEIVLAVDTSGSIGPHEIDRFGAEVEGILSSFDCSLTIVYADCAIQHVQKWTSSDGPLVMEPRGGGGTSHIPVFEWVAAQSSQPTCLIALTDLCSDFPKSPPDYPVLWATTEKGSQGPWGQTVEIEL